MTSEEIRLYVDKAIATLDESQFNFEGSFITLLLVELITLCSMQQQHSLRVRR